MLEKQGEVSFSMSNKLEEKNNLYLMCCGQARQVAMLMGQLLNF